MKNNIYLLLSFLILLNIAQPAAPRDCASFVVDQNNYNKAEMCYKYEARRINSYQSYIGLGTIYTLKKEYKEALKMFQKAYSLNPNSPSAMYALGVGLINVSKNSETISRAYNNRSNESDFALVGSEGSTKIYSQLDQKEVKGVIIDYENQR